MKFRYNEFNPDFTHQCSHPDVRYGSYKDKNGYSIYQCNVCKQHIKDKPHLDLQRKQFEEQKEPKQKSYIKWNKDGSMK